MRVKRVSTGELLDLSADQPIGAGGEAIVLPVGQEPDLAAKLYHKAEDAQRRKLAVMLANPPVDPSAEQSHVSIAWPVDQIVIAGASVRFAGYLMPRVHGSLPLFEYYNPASRRRHAPLFSYRYLHRTARNLCSAVRALHDRGYVIGDLNESNILVNAGALVTLVDTDSFQVPDAVGGSVFRCPVGKPEYTAPEIYGRSFGEFDRLQTHDLFALGVLVFQILMEGSHPFAGEYTLPGDAPAYGERIRDGHFPYGTRPSPYRPLRLAPSIDILNPEIKRLMLRCFDDGHQAPSMRPSAAAWLAALQNAEEALIGCEVNDQHIYGSHLNECPWCLRRSALGGIDPFPSKQEVASGIKRPEPRRKPILEETYAMPSAGTSGYSQSTPPVSLPIPSNPFAWAALICAFVSAALYLMGGFAPALAIAGTSLVLAVAAFLKASVWKNSGRWIAAFSSLMAVYSGLVAGIDFRDLRSPPLVRSVHLVSPARSVVFSGEKIVTGTERAEDQRLIGGRVESWALPLGRKSDTLAEYAGTVVGIQAARDQHTLLVATSSPMEASRIDLVDARYSGVKAPVYTAGNGQICEALSPNARSIAVGSLNGFITVLDVGSNAVRAKLAVKGEVLAMAYGPGGDMLAVATGSPPGSILSGTITVFDIGTGKPRWMRNAHSNAVTSVIFTRTGIYTAGNDGEIRLWNADTGTIERRIDTGAARISAIALSADESLVAAAMEPMAADSTDYAIGLWSLASGGRLGHLSGHTQRITALAFDQKNTTLASVGMDSRLRIWRLSRILSGRH